MRQWAFVRDMNRDGLITISDVWLWFEWLLYYPGDCLVAWLILDAPGVAQFLEVDQSFLGGRLSGFLSVALWYFLIKGLMKREMWFDADYDPLLPFWKRRWGAIPNFAFAGVSMWLVLYAAFKFAGIA